MWTLLSVLAALVAFGAGAPKQNGYDLLPYRVSFEQGIVGNELDEQHGPFLIPDGMCISALNDELTCNGGWPPIAVRFTVQDAVGYPLVRIEDSLQSAKVWRDLPCKGPAIIDVRLACAYLTNHTEVS